MFRGNLNRHRKDMQTAHRPSLSQHVNTQPWQREPNMLNHPDGNNNIRTAFQREKMHKKAQTQDITKEKMNSMNILLKRTTERTVGNVVHRPSISTSGGIA